MDHLVNDKYSCNKSNGIMKTLSKKLCPQCNIEFEFEAWNKKKIFCSRICKDVSGRGSRITNEDWIIKAQDKHGNRYDYSYVDLYHKEDNKIKIRCIKHGIFLQNPSQHLIGKGCKKCANEAQYMTTEEFIQKGNKIHNNKYDYSLVEYKDTRQHITIICPKHGIYLQTPFQHLYHKAGCHICSQIYTSSKCEKEWLDNLGIPDDENHRQVKIESENKKFIVDGFFENSIYEFLGDFWHGNPMLFSSSDLNPLAKKSYGELYNSTMDRISILEKLGYNVIYIWESEWHRKK